MEEKELLRITKNDAGDSVAVDISVHINGDDGDLYYLASALVSVFTRYPAVLIAAQKFLDDGDSPDEEIELDNSDISIFEDILKKKEN